MKKSFLLIVIVLLTSECFSQMGVLDNTFGIGGKVTTAVGTDSRGFTMAIQSDGKIVVAGASFNGANFDFAATRYNTDGSLDTTFGNGGKVTTAVGDSTDVCTSVVIQNDGKIVLAGYSFDSVTHDDFALVRYNSDGILDTTFGTNGIVTTDWGGRSDIAYSIAIQSNDKIVVAGGASSFMDNAALFRYNSDGTLDTTFGTGGMAVAHFGSGPGDGFNSVKVLSNGKIVVAGYSFDANLNAYFLLVRFNSNGSIDTLWGPGAGGAGTISFGNNQYSEGVSLAIQGDGKIVVAGLTSSDGNHWDVALVRITSNGANLDGTFGTGGKTIPFPFPGCNNILGSIVLQNNGKLLVVGSNSCFNPSKINLLRLNTNGILDTTFGVNNNGVVVTAIGGIDDEGTSVAIQSDGKIVVAGDSKIGANFEFAVLRYNNSITTTVAEVIEPTGFSVYPNPFTSQTTIAFAEEQKNIMIRIFEMSGKEIKTIDFSGKQLTIDRGEMKVGIYFVQVIDKNWNVVSKKIVVQ